MSGFRWEIEAFAHPRAREWLLGGGERQLVRLGLFDGPGTVDRENQPTAKPDAFTDLRPSEARRLAIELLAAAEHAELRTTEGALR